MLPAYLQDAVRTRDRDGGLRLHVGVLYGLGGEGLVDNKVAGGQGGRGVAAPDPALVHQVVLAAPAHDRSSRGQGRLGVRQGRKLVRALDDQGRGGQGGGAGLGHHQGYHLALALYRALGEHRVVADYLAEADLPGNVRGCEHRQDPRRGAGCFGVHAQVFRAHEAGIDRDGVDHARKLDVVRVLGPACHLGPGVVAKGCFRFCWHIGIPLWHRLHGFVKGSLEVQDAPNNLVGPVLLELVIRTERGLAAAWSSNRRG